MTNLTNNKAVLSWIDEMTAITKPDKIVWITGEEEQLDALREQAVKEGILIKLNPDKLPGCYLHRTDPDDVARVEDRTFICCEKEEDAGPTNHWVEPKEMYEKMYALADGAYKGRTMYIIPYSMSIIGSPFAKYGFELTDSIYVVLNMHIMTRIGKAVCDALGDDEGFIKGLHCQCNLDKDNKYIVHFPQDNTIISMNSNYGGNVLQGKKCFALRIASNLGRQEGWMAEHMLILGIQNPRGEIKYISAAFPSACGKTNLAMLIPPEGLQRWGWRVWCVGDDIAWLRVGKDGRLWAVNPENGFFGVAPGTSMKSNPNALISTHKDTIFTNVALDLSDNTVWWEGLNKTPPARAIDWRGRPWTPQSPEKAAHPNSRFTAPARNCPCLSPEFDNPEGVPISAIVFGGRRAKTAPLVYQSFNWQHGVFVGAHGSFYDHGNKVTEFDNAVRPAICVSFDVALGRWTPSSSDSSSGLLAMSNRPISTRSGPSTKYDELGTYWNDGGHTVTVLSRASGNDIWWLQVEFEYGGKTVRVYTGEQRIDIDVSRVPIEGGAIGSGRVTSTTTAYYGPGTNYKQHQQKISSGTTGAVMAWENGYVCLEFQPSGSYQIRRVWLPENVVSITYY